MINYNKQKMDLYTNVLYKLDNYSIAPDYDEREKTSYVVWVNQSSKLKVLKRFRYYQSAKDYLHKQVINSNKKIKDNL